MIIPTLETQRLVLRGYTAPDLTECAALWADPNVVRYIGGQPSTEEQAWARLLRYVGHWELMGFGFWAVFDRAGGEFLGEIGAADFRRDVTPPIGNLETGWVLRRSAHGKGYATEALRAVLAWLDATFPGKPTVCVIEPANAPSLRVAAKCGYEPIGSRTYHGAELTVLRRLA
ncbi:MAG TPA: GNAT family N-acetyltransferase [Kofleriaceae bacterium]|jgi:RimJ/RimL family protein N-acetyltransferase